jgi:hypothetical protein
LRNEKKTQIGDKDMLKPLTLAISVVALGLAAAQAQDKPAVVIHPFTVAPGVDFPYEMNQLQTAAIAEIKSKDGEKFDVIAEVIPNRNRVYLLDGEIKEWYKGNTAERMAIAPGSMAGWEHARIHYWLTDKEGKRIFQRTDTIRPMFMRNAHGKNVGTLAHPFGLKIAERLKSAKLGPESAAK